MELCDFPAVIVLPVNARIPQGGAGTMAFRVFTMEGVPLDLSGFDRVVLRMTNFPEKNELIEKECFFGVPGRCCMNFEASETLTWLASPYYSQIGISEYLRDQSLISASTGYVPISRPLALTAVTQSFVVGEIVTGANSGMTATVLSTKPHHHNQQLLDVCLISGEFADGEPVSGNKGGTGEVAAVLGTPEPVLTAFADDVESFASVNPKDILELSSEEYGVLGLHPVVPDWIELSEPLGLSGSSLSYEIKTFDPALSVPKRSLSSNSFVMQVMETI